jgi:curved DNA-binding protein CbpA
MNFYAVLGISRDADDETIRSAYRILARRYHPDRGAGSSSEKFRQVNQAYETLINPGTRQSYDLSLQWAQRQVPVRVERKVAHWESLPREDAGLFGRVAAPASPSVFRNSAGLDEFFDRWFRSLDDPFFDTEWP